MRLLGLLLLVPLLVVAASCGGGSDDGAATPDESVRSLSASLDDRTTVELQISDDWSVDVGSSSLIVAERSSDLDPGAPPEGARLLVGVSEDPLDAAQSLFPADLSDSEAASRLDVVDGPSQLRAGAGSGYDAVSITTRESTGSESTTRRYVTLYNDAGAYLIVLEAPTAQWDGASERLDALVDTLRFQVSARPARTATAIPTAVPGSLLPEIPAGWTLDRLETFDESGGWFEGSREDAVSRTRAELVDGAYRLTVDADTDQVRPASLPFAVEPVLAITTEATRTSESAECGLTLGYESGWQLYLITSDPGQQLVVAAALGEEAFAVVPPGVVPAVVSNATNRLTLVAEGERIRVFVNGDLVGDVNDGRFGPVSSAGFVVGNPAGGGSGTCAFDNLAIHVP